MRTVEVQAAVGQNSVFSDSFRELLSDYFTSCPKLTVFCLNTASYIYTLLNSLNRTGCQAGGSVGAKKTQLPHSMNSHSAWYMGSDEWTAVSDTHKWTAIWDTHKWTAVSVIQTGQIYAGYRTTDCMTET
jgi:hypothetical protein